MRLSARAALACVLVLSACGKGPSDKAAGAASAPELKLDTLLQAPQASLSGWAELKGKVAVLEFWATWCDPCVEEIPHFNGLVDRLQGKPVVFISISDEPRAKIEAFLKDHPMKGWVAADAGAAYKSFGVRSRPHTIIVDAQGKLAGVAYPGFLKPEDILGVVAGKALARSALSAEEPAELMAPTASSALFEARVSSSSGKNFSFASSEESFKGRGLSAEWLLAQAYGVNTARVVVKPKLSGSFDVDVMVPPGRAADLLPACQQAAGIALGVKLKRQTLPADALVLSKSAQGAALKAAAGKNGKHGFSTGPGRITAAGMSLADLAAVLEESLGTPVVDETGLKGRYEFELTWDRENPDALPGALQSQLGLKTGKAKRPLELLVFTSDPKK